MFLWFIYVVFILSSLDHATSSVSQPLQCTLKDTELKCGSSTCQTVIGSPRLPQGKYRIGKKQTETAEGLPSTPYYYVYKAINGDQSKGFWAETSYIPEMRCTKETPWMNSENLAVANSFGLQNQQCYEQNIKIALDGLTAKRFDVKVCPSANACQSGQCANLAALGALTREYIADLSVEN